MPNVRIDLLVDADHGLRGRADVPRRGGRRVALPASGKLERRAGSSGRRSSRSPLPYIAARAGWILTEIGRQPWIVQGLLKTGRATRRASPRPGSRSASAVFVALYLRSSGSSTSCSCGATRGPTRPSAATATEFAPPGGDVLMDLQILWFVLIAVLWAGYFLLEGFDFGVGMLLPFVPRNEAERGAMFESIGPVWDGNEVWLVVAGGATFAAFPAWYATMFSGFYLALLLLLVLPDRPRASRSSGARRARARAGGRCGCGRTRSGASARRCSGASALANLLHGVPINSNGDFTRQPPRPVQPVHGVRGHRVRARSSRSTARPTSTLRTTGRPLRARRRRRAEARHAGAIAVGGGSCSGRSPSRSTATTRTSSRPSLPAALGHRGARARRRSSSTRDSSGLGVRDDRARDGRASWRRSSPASIRASWSRAPTSATASTVDGAASAHYALAVMSVVALICAPARPPLPGLDVLRLPRAGSAATSPSARAPALRPAARRQADRARPRPAPPAPSPPGAPPARAGRGRSVSPVRAARPRPGGR